jgi:hypothetical protein
MVWIIIGVVAIFVIAMLWSISNFESSCTGDCQQGRRCNCLLGRNDDEHI